MATLAPSAARRLAIAAPIPRDAPVPSAILPSRFFDMGVLPSCLECVEQLGVTLPAGAQAKSPDPRTASDNFRMTGLRTYRPGMAAGSKAFAGQNGLVWRI